MSICGFGGSGQHQKRRRQFASGPRSLPSMDPGWRAPETARLGDAVLVMLLDGDGNEYKPRFQCIRTARGWISASSGKLLQVDVVGWR